MQTARVIKTAYTGLSFLDNGFSGRILQKYGFISDLYLNGLLMIFRKNRSQGRNESTRVLNNIFNPTFILRFYNSYYMNYGSPRLTPSKGQIEESTGSNWERMAPDSSYTTAWNLNLTRHIETRALNTLVNNVFSSMGDRVWFALNGTIPHILPGSTIFYHDGVPGASDPPGMEPVVPGGIEIKLTQQRAQTRSEGIPGRSLPGSGIVRLNYERQRIRSELLNTVRELQPGSNRYPAVKYPVVYGYSSLNVFKDSGRVPERRQRDNLPGYPKGYRLGTMMEGHRNLLDRYQSTGWNEIKKAEVQLAFELHLLETRRQKLTNRLRRLEIAIHENRFGKVPGSGTQISDQMKTDISRLGTTQSRLSEESPLKQDQQHILIKQSAKSRVVTGDAKSTEVQPRINSGSDRMFAEAESGATVQLPRGIREKEGTLQGIDSSMPGGTVLTAENRVAAKGWTRLTRGLYNQVFPRLVTETAFVESVRYYGLLNEIQAQESKILRHRLNLQKVLALQEYMNDGFKLNKNENISPFITEHILSSQSPKMFARQGILQVNEALAIKRELERYSKTLTLAESLIKLEELIRHETRRQHRKGIYTDSLTIALTRDPVYSLSTTSKTDLFDLQTRVKRTLELAGIHPGESSTFPVQQFIKRSLTGWFASEARGSKPSTKRYQEQKNRIRKQDDVPGDLEFGGVRYDGSDPVKEIFKEHLGFRLQSTHAGISDFSFTKNTRLYQVQSSKSRISQKEASKERREVIPDSKAAMAAEDQRQAMEPDYYRNVVPMRNDDILNHSYNSIWSRQESANLTTGIWDRIRHNSNVISFRRISDNRTQKTPGNMKTPATMEDGLRIGRSINQSSRFFQVPVRPDTAGIDSSIASPGNINLYQPQNSSLNINKTELKTRRLQRVTPNLDSATRIPEQYMDYSQMEFLRRSREPDYESNAAKTRSETIIPEQVYPQEKRLKIDPAEMERLVNNVYNEIERRLEFERQRRGL